MKISNRYLIGYDLGDTTSQISYCQMGHQEVETLPVIAGTKQYNIPTVLCKRNEINQWFYGKEAIKQAEKGEGILLENLLSKAVEGNTLVIDEQEYDPVTLLSLFVKKSFKLFSIIATPDKIDTLVITTRNLNPRIVEVLEQVVETMALPAKRVLFQNYGESLYYYMLYQPKDLWYSSAVAFDFEEDAFTVYELCANRRTKPIVAYVREKNLEGYQVPKWGDEEEHEGEKEQLDQQFLENLPELLQNGNASSIHLLGIGFESQWLKKSLRYMCQGRRVFQGNNLYSKGAAYSALETLCPSQRGKEMVFLGEEKLKSNVGLYALMEGKESYRPLIDAGVNWYDVKGSRQFILESGNSFMLTITPLVQKEKGDVVAGKYPVIQKEIVLNGLPQRPERATRIELRYTMKNVNCLMLEVEDMGFGAIIKSTHHVWNYEIDTSGE